MHVGQLLCIWFDIEENKWEIFFGCISQNFIFFFKWQIVLSVFAISSNTKDIKFLLRNSRKLNVIKNLYLKLQDVLNVCEL